MICRPEKNDIPEMKRIWELCFGDSRENVNCFYDKCFSPDECYIAKENGIVQAVVQTIRCRIVSDNNSIDASYLYAVCTHPDFQGRGVMSNLIETALENERKNGIKAVLCVPANEDLFGFYRRFGFENAVYCSKKQSTSDELERMSVKCSYSLNGEVKEFNKKRNEVLSSLCDNAFVSFPDKYISLSIGSGYSYFYTDHSYAIFSVEDDCVKVADCAFPDEIGFGEICFALLNETDKNFYSFEYTIGSSDNVLKGVINIPDKNFSLDKHIYLGFKME